MIIKNSYLGGYHSEKYLLRDTKKEKIFMENISGCILYLGIVFWDKASSTKEN